MRFRNLARVLLPFIALSACLAAARADDAASGFRWPNGAETAVVLTYDDALASQLDFALPALNDRNFKGTFFLSMASSELNGRAVDWMAAATAGHELANHTVFHPCRADMPGRDWVNPDFDLSKYTLTRLESELSVAESFLHALDGESERTFAYPCGDTTLAGGASYAGVVDDRYLAARGVGPTPATIQELSFNATHAFDPAGKSAAQLIAYVESARDSGLPAVFVFHGVAGDYLVTDADAHDGLLDYLAERRAMYWVTPYKSAMAHAASEFKRLGWPIER